MRYKGFFISVNFSEKKKKILAIKLKVFMSLVTNSSMTDNPAWKVLLACPLMFLRP